AVGVGRIVGRVGRFDKVGHRLDVTRSNDWSGHVGCRHSGILVAPRQLRYIELQKVAGPEKPTDFPGEPSRIIGQTAGTASACTGGTTRRGPSLRRATRVRRRTAT